MAYTFSQSVANFIQFPTAHAQRLDEFLKIVCWKFFAYYFIFYD